MSTSIGFRFLVPAVLVLCPVFGAAQTPPGTVRQPVVYSAEVDSIIHPVSAEFMIDIMNRADADDAALVLFILRTPGGLVDATRDIVTKMISAKTPVAVYVGPSGARA